MSSRLMSRRIRGNKELVWTLTTHGKTIKAHGTLRPQDYQIDNMVMTSETGAIVFGAGGEHPSNPGKRGSRNRDSR